MPFYNRFLFLAARHRGLAPLPSQTPLEFGAALGRTLDGTNGTASAQDLPTKIVEAYYVVRFGGRMLNAAEQADVNLGIERLEAALTVH